MEKCWLDQQAKNAMRTSFSFVELVFTIVILGILALVAIPRYFGIERHAQKSIAHSFAATLTRTVGHSFWSKSLAMGTEGSIRRDGDGDDSKFYGKSLEAYVSIPIYFDKTSVNFSHCAKVGEIAQPFIEKNESAGGEYNIFCLDGNSSIAPHFVASKENVYAF